MKEMHIAVVVIEGVLASAVLGFKDIFDICNTYCKEEGEVKLVTSFVGISEKESISGIAIPLHKIPYHKHFDLIVVPPIIRGHDIKISSELKKWLIDSFHSGTILSAACMGSFILAQTGLLDFKKATTHWLLEEKFKQKFPQVILESEKILIDEGNIITSGGITAYIDLGLYLIEKKLSMKTANKCASLLLVDRGRESQVCYKDLSSMILVEDKNLKKLLRWMKKDLNKNLSVKMLAKHMKLNERSFLRHFKKEVGITPNHYLQNLRIEEAKRLLVNSIESFQQITYSVGFSNESSFRRLFKRETSLNPGEYRKKFKFKS